MMFTPCYCSFNDHPLEWVDDIKYLGITIDNKLRFHKQTSDLRITLTHLCRPVRSTFAVRETASLGIMGAPRIRNK